RRFALDAAILFSDILTVPDAMGLGLQFSAGEGPRFERPVRDEQAIARLAAPDPTVELRYVLDAVREIRRSLAGRVPLIGFSGSPYTLACYMVEGGGSDDFRTLKAMLYGRPDLLHRILEVNARAVTDYLNAQIEAGIQVAMLFDTWGGNLSTAAYEEFSLAYVRRVVAGLTRESEGRRVPVILFTKGGGEWLEAMASAGCDALGIDWSTDLSRARRRVGTHVALQGNLDPAVLQSSPEIARAEARRVLDAYGNAAGHVFNLGHGITPHASIDAVLAVVDEVRAYSKKLRSAISRGS
ncbi:MAG: uroporphyrinogen decarboxylase, partial [Burkholderiales bacterium]